MAETFESTTAADQNVPGAFGVSLGVEQLAGLQAASRRFTVSAVILCLVASAALWSRAAAEPLLFWSGLTLVLLLLREMYVSVLAPDLEATLAGLVLLALTLACAICWAALPALFVDASDASSPLLILAIVAILITSALIWLSSSALQYTAFAVPVLLSTCWAVVTLGSPVYLATALLTLIWLAITVYQAAQLYADAEQAVQQRHLNQQYATRLQSGNAKLRQTRQAMQRASVDKSEFLTAAGSQVRQPLATMQLLLESLRASGSETERVRIGEHLEEVVRSLDQSFTALIDMAELESAAIKPDLQSVQLGTIMGDIRRQAEAAAQRKGLKYRHRVQDAVLRTDPNLLRRIVQHLVNNAMQHTEAGGVLVATRARAREVWLDVWDTGPGIDEETMQELFVEFRKGGEHGDGLGLGLAIVQRLCEMLDHELEVRSKPGRGSLFRLRIARGSPRGLRDGEEQEEVSTANLEGRTVLLIDSNRAVLDALEPVLRRTGCAVWPVVSSDEALSLVMMDAVMPDAIVCDQRLGSLSGFEVIAAVRAEMIADTPALMMTNEASKQTREIARGERVTLLMKPVDTGRLVRALSALCTTSNL